MIDEKFIILGFIINLLGSAAYITAVLRGQAKPNRITWALWSLAPLLAFSAQLSEGVGMQALMTFSSGFIPLLIFISSFVGKNAYWKLDKTDYLFGALALIGLILWLITGEGMLAIVFGIAADALAAIPTIIKSYQDPSSENSTAFGAGFINSSITLLTIHEWRFEEYGFSLYIFLITALMFSLIQFRLGEKIRIKISK